MSVNRILTAANATLLVTNLTGDDATSGSSALSWVPLGTVGGSATGELGVKVIGPAGSGSMTVQGAADDGAVKVGNPVGVAGKAVTSLTYSPAYSDDDVAMLAVDGATGRLLIQGNVGGYSTYVTTTITFSVGGAGATGDYMGTTTTPQAFSNAVRFSAGTGVIKSIAIVDKLTTAAVALELWLFSATFTAPTDNAAWAITDADALNCIGVIPIGTSKWYASSNNKVYSDDTVGMVIKPAATSLFYALVARGTTPAWSTGDLQISIGILQD